MKKIIKYFGLCCLGLCLLGIGYSQETKVFAETNIHLKGELVIEQITSPNLRGNLLGDSHIRNSKVYLPPGYNDFPENHFPVVYLLHGYNSNYNSFYHYNAIGDRLDKLISEKKIAPMIVVTPDGNNKYGGSFYTNSYVSGNWADYIVKDVIQYIESNYRVLGDGKSRALGGFSMGGYGTMKLALNNPLMFNSITTIGAANLDFNKLYNSSGYWSRNIKTAALNPGYDATDPWYIRVFSAMQVAYAPDSLASPLMGWLPYTRDTVLVDSIWMKWLEHDPLTMLSSKGDNLLKLDGIQMYIGSSDGLREANESFHQALLNEQIDHEYITYSGGHTIPEVVIDSMFTFFSRKLESMIPSIFLGDGYYFAPSDSLLVKSSKTGSILALHENEFGERDTILDVRVGETDSVRIQEKVSLEQFPMGISKFYSVSSEGGVSMIPGQICLVEKVPSVSIKLRDADTGEAISDGRIYTNGRLFPMVSGSELDLTRWVHDTCRIRAVHNQYYDFDSTLVIKKDTILIVYLKTTIPIPELQMKNAPVCAGSGLLGIKLSETGMAYLTGEESPAIIDSIKNQSEATFYTPADTWIKKSLIGLSNGNYKLFGISSLGKLAQEFYQLRIVDHVPECILEPVDGNTGVIIDSCLLILNQSDTIPQEDGRFYLTGLVYDSCFIHLSHKDYDLIELPLEVLNDTTIQILLTKTIGVSNRMKTPNEIRIFPNPVSGILLIETNLPGRKDITFSSIGGQQVHSVVMEGFRKSLDISKLEDGIYFITIRSEETVASRRIIKL